jgi:hypothetical protein
MFFEGAWEFARCEAGDGAAERTRAIPSDLEASRNSSNLWIDGRMFVGLRCVHSLMTRAASMTVTFVVNMGSSVELPGM